MQPHQQSQTDNLLIEPSLAGPSPIYLGMEWTGFSQYGNTTTSSIIVNGMNKSSETDDNSLLDPDLLQLKTSRP